MEAGKKFLLLILNVGKIVTNGKAEFHRLQGRFRNNKSAEGK